MMKAIKIILISLCASFFALSLSYIWLNPVSTLMLKAYLMGDPVKREWVRLERLPKNFAAILIASEDGQFCRHHGVDWRELYLNIFDKNGVQRGASTLSMQVARNLFLWQGRNLLINAPRKMLELPLAVYLDTLYSKKRMLEIYINIAQWGPTGEYGLGAAAHTHFNKPVAQLTSQEMALLVAILPNPHARDAAEPEQLVLQKAQIILRRSQNANVSCL
jgi:monofunctional glycosyltransferase